MDQARCCAGLPKTNGLTANQSTINAAWSHRRVHTGTSVSGVLAQRVHALHGLQCRAKIARRTRRAFTTLSLRRWRGFREGYAPPPLAEKCAIAKRGSRNRPLFGATRAREILGNCEKREEIARLGSLRWTAAHHGDPARRRRKNPGLVALTAVRLNQPMSAAHGALCEGRRCLRAGLRGHMRSRWPGNGAPPPFRVTRQRGAPAPLRANFRNIADTGQ